MITTSSFFSSTLNTVDEVIGHFVSNAYTHFVQANADVITLLFTVYIIVLGYQFLSHNHHFNLATVTRHLIVMLCVYGLVMNWKLYELFIYNIFTDEPANIASILVESAGSHTTGSIATTLDAIFSSVIHASSELLGQVGFSVSSIPFLFYALLVFVIGTLMCIFALLLFIYAKMMMAVGLALGPLFILFLMWDATRGLFSAWLNQLITIALIPIVTSAILVLMLSVVNVTLPAINQPVNQMQFYGVAPFLGLSLATTMILSQVLKICSSLGGGISLASLATGGAIASDALEKTGIASVARKAMSSISQFNRGHYRGVSNRGHYRGNSHGK